MVHKVSPTIPRLSRRREHARPVLDHGSARAGFRLALRLAVTFGVAASALALADAATAVPQGNSAVSQYLEQVPSAHGGRQVTATPNAGSGNAIGPQGPAGGAGNPAAATGNPAPGTGTIPESTRRVLNSLGSVAQADYALAQSTAPHRSSGSSATVASAGGASPATNLLKALGGSATGGGLGLLLPIALIVILFGAGGIAMLRRRRAS